MRELLESIEKFIDKSESKKDFLVPQIKETINRAFIKLSEKEIFEEATAEELDVLPLARRLRRKYNHLNDKK